MREHKTFCVLLITTLTLTFGGLSYWALRPSPVSPSSLSFIEEEKWTQEIGEFLRRKEKLKEKVRRKMNNRVYYSLAVYLFPELLPSGNLEKEASEVWTSHQRFIEQNPHTPHARRHFQYLEASIINYESLSRRKTVLSEVARKVLKLYQSLSSPGK